MRNKVLAKIMASFLFRTSGMEFLAHKKVTGSYRRNGSNSLLKPDTESGRLHVARHQSFDKSLPEVFPLIVLLQL